MGGISDSTMPESFLSNYAAFFQILSRAIDKKLAA
jgi:hypothetical protein